MTDPMLDYSLSQAAKAVDLVTNDDDILEALFGKYKTTTRTPGRLRSA